MLFTTPGIGEHISGVILFDETIHQTADDDTPLVEVLEKAGVIPGIKVVVPDQGSPLKREMFDKKTEFLKLSDFRRWLEKYNLTGS